MGFLGYRQRVDYSVIQFFSLKLVLEWNFMNDIRHFSIVSKYFPNEGSKLTWKRSLQSDLLVHASSFVTEVFWLS